MGYSESLEIAGAKVVEFKTFGSYQGDWLALVEYNGEKGFVEGSYGSCSGCDAFEAEFGWNDEIIIKQEDGFYYKGNHSYDEEEKITEQEANELNKVLSKRLCEFGESYLKPGGLISKEFLVNKLQKEVNDNDWGDYQKMLDWVKQVQI